jgi:tellurite resistance protein
LSHFSFAWFVPVMGWTGLGLAWLKAPPDWGLFAHGFSLMATAIAVLMFLSVAGVSVLRWLKYPQAVRADFLHPVRHAFIAAVPISLLVLAGLGVAWGLTDSLWVQGAWLIGSVAELLITVWVLSRCMRPADAGGMPWPVITPLLIIPIVGNVLVPLAGLHWQVEGWVAAQFGVGVFLWPLVLGLLLARSIQVGPLPARLTPTLFVMVAPPSVMGLSFLQWQAPFQLAWAAWGVAWMSLLWSLTRLPQIRALPFGMSHWGMSFPLATFAALCLRLSLTPQGAWLSIPAMLSLVVATGVILWLSLKTLQGLLNGHLLVPEG